MEVSVKHKAHNNTAMIKTVNRYIPQREGYKVSHHLTYLIIVTDATDAVSVNFSGRCKFLLI